MAGATSFSVTDNTGAQDSAELYTTPTANAQINGGGFIAGLGGGTTPI